MKISQSYLHAFILFVGIPVSVILIIIGSININYYRKNPFTDLEYDIQKNNSVSLCYTEKCILYNTSCVELNKEFETHPEYLRFFSEKSCLLPSCTLSEISSCLDSLISSWTRTYYIQDKIGENGLYKYNTGIIMVIFGIFFYFISMCIVRYIEKNPASRIHPTEIVSV
jgi:hypothetical protein